MIVFNDLDKVEWSEIAADISRPTEPESRFRRLVIRVHPRIGGTRGKTIDANRLVGL
jgi:hypothetical protein